MESGKRKIIFLDIDGTLTEPGTNVIPESALKGCAAERRLREIMCFCVQDGIMICCRRCCSMDLTV